VAREARISSFIDSAIEEASSKVNILKVQEANLALNLKELEKKRDKLSKEIYDLEQEAKKVKADSKAEAEKILKNAQDKMNKAIEKDGTNLTLQGELKQKQNEAENLIKSNQGLQKTLEKLNGEAKNKIDTLKKIEKLIKETIGE